MLQQVFHTLRRADWLVIIAWCTIVLMLGAFWVAALQWIAEYYWESLGLIMA